MKALVVADADSYLKWGVARALDLTPYASVEVVVVDSAVTPSPRQRADAVAGRWVDVPVVKVPQVRERCADVDVVVLACRGPMIEHLMSAVFGDVERRPVIAAGIPGLWFPPTERGLAFRADVDVLVVHSERERRALEDLGVNCGREVGLAHLAHGVSRPAQGDVTMPDVRSADAPVIFAPQALVPRTVAERRRLWDALVATARAHPEVPVHVKLRGARDEAQTHREFASFPALADAHEGALPDNLAFVRGPLADHLARARGLVTVSSTAALEAAAAGVPTLVVGDFGVDRHNLNLVFEDSGLVGSLEDLVALRFFHPRPGWMADNYFHDPERSDWAEVVAALAGDREELVRLRGRRPRTSRARGARARIARSRRRAQALGGADTWWCRAAQALVSLPGRLRARYLAGVTSAESS